MSLNSALSISIAPNEIVFPGASIAVRARAALDPQSAQAGIILEGFRGQVMLSRSKREARWCGGAPLPPGPQRLKIGAISTARGKILCGRREIPFFVADSAARIPSSLAVTHMVRLRIGALGTERLSSHCRPDGAYIEIMKAFDRKTGNPVQLAFDQTGRRVDPARIFAKIAKARARKYGKLHETLHRRVACAKASERLPVALWLQCDAALALDKKKSSGETRRPSREAVARAVETRRTVAAFVSRCSDRLHASECDPVAPVVYAALTPAQIRQIAKDDQVTCLFLHEREGIDDLGASIAIARSDAVHAAGFDGTGVRVAVWEDRPDSTADLVIADSFRTSGFPAGSDASDHSRHTHATVKNIQSKAPHGHAPGCDLYSANTKELEALAWAHSSGCTVISQSFHRSSEAGSSVLSYDDIYKDHLALTWPYPTIFQAAGNYWSGPGAEVDPPADEYVNHKGYNSLAVGNHDDGASAMSGDSVYRNPASPHGDRELPEIAANGTSVTTVGLTKSGTSMAAPAAAGCCALIQQANGTLKSWPEGCRAILLASARRNVGGSTWWRDNLARIDASDGSGAINAAAAFDLARRRRRRNTAGALSGFDIGTVAKADFDRSGQSTFSYTVTIPRDFFVPPQIKVALAWCSQIFKFQIPIVDIEFPFLSELMTDLDLEIFDRSGARVGYSGSWDNSYEIAEFAGTPGETYTIRLRLWSGWEEVYYGIAWAASGGLRGAVTEIRP